MFQPFYELELRNITSEDKSASSTKAVRGMSRYSLKSKLICVRSCLSPNKTNKRELPNVIISQITRIAEWGSHCNTSQTLMLKFILIKLNIVMGLGPSFLPHS